MLSGAAVSILHDAPKDDHILQWEACGAGLAAISRVLTRSARGRNRILSLAIQH
jgi:hypothetical protein